MALTHVKSQKCMVFCNGLESCQRVYGYLQRKHPSLIAILHGDLDDQERRRTWNKFLTNPDLRVLVCTDIASRGLDSLCVDHIIHYDFPHSAIDYLHRVGRTARRGNPGRVTSLVTRKDKPLAMAIQVSTIS
jgi:ATP-dependent RNA helicase DDX28